MLSAYVFKIYAFKNFFYKCYYSVKQFGSRSGPTKNVGPDVGPNCLQSLLADDTSRQS